MLFMSIILNYVQYTLSQRFEPIHEANRISLENTSEEVEVAHDS